MSPRHRAFPRRLIVAGRSVALAGLALLSIAAIALAASPSASPDTAGDPRSSGQGPGLVGDPLFAVVAVILIATAAIVLTLAWIRLTARQGA